MKKQNLLSLLFIASLFTACAFNNSDSNSSDETRVLDENRQQLLKAYSEVTGIYEGSITAVRANPSKPGNLKPASIPIQLAFYVEDEVTGKDSNGKTKILPVLKLRYRQLDAVRADTLLEANYIAANGQLNAATKGGSISVRSILSGTEITGEVIRTEGKVGNFTATLVSKNVGAGLTDDGSDYYSRVMEQYKNLLGYYKGKITPALGGFQGPLGGKPYRAELKIDLVPDIRDGNTGFKILATLYRPELDPDLIGPRRLDVAYSPEFVPAMVIMTGNGSTSSIPDAHLIEVSGTLENGVLTATISNRLGPMGTMILTKVSP